MCMWCLLISYHWFNRTVKDKKLYSYTSTVKSAKFMTIHAMFENQLILHLTSVTKSVCKCIK